MQSGGVRRLVVISVIGEGESVANANWYGRLFLSTLLRSEMKDKAVMEAIVGASGPDWIIVRLPFLNDDPGTGSIHVFSAESGEIAHKMTRVDLATFMVTQLSSDKYLQKPWPSPTASSPKRTPLNAQSQRMYASEKMGIVGTPANGDRQLIAR